MAKKIGSVLGIDIGSHSIKVCEVKASGRGATVSAVGVIPTPEGAVDHSGVYNPEAVGAAIKQAASFAGASSPMAVVSISGQQSVLVRVLEVPRMTDEKELASHMEWEINKNIPFAETTVMSDYKVLPGDDPNSADMDVVMAISPQSAVDTIVECIKKAGRKPHAIDVPPLGHARALATSMPETEGTATCVVDLGHLSTQINIYQGGKLVLPRPVPGGSSHITQAIADAMQLGLQEAEDYKINRFQIHEGAVAGQGGFGGFDAFGGATQSFQTFDFNPGGYQAAGPADAYDPSVTVGLNPDPSPAAPADDLAINPITGLPYEAAAEVQYDPITGLPIRAETDVQAATNAVASATGYGIEVDPITGLPVEPLAQPMLDSLDSAAPQAPSYSQDPFAASAVPDAFAPAADPNLTQTFDAGWIPIAPDPSAADPSVTEPAAADSSAADSYAPAPFAPAMGITQEDPAYNAVSPILEELVAEIQRSIDYYTGKGGSVSRIVLSGGGSRLRGLDGYLARSLNVQCERIDPLRNLGFTPRKVGMDYVNDHREQLALAVGTGLHILFD